MERVSKKAITFWRIRLFAVAGVCMVIASLFSYRLCGILAIVFLFVFLIYYPVKYKNLQYGIDHNGHLFVCKGVFYRFETHISCVQYVNFVADPLQRIMGLCTAVVLAPGARMYIPCLDEKCRKNLLGLIGR